MTNAVPIPEDDDGWDNLDATLDNAFIKEDNIGPPGRHLVSPRAKCWDKAASVASARSPSIECSLLHLLHLHQNLPSRSIPCQGKFQPVASLASSSSSSSSYNRNEEMPSSSLGNRSDNCGLTPVEFAKQRRKLEEAQKKKTGPPPNVEKKESSKSFQRSDSKYSDSGWIVDDSDDYYSV
ncbi:hypothetical protein BT96DRAFT_994174 [Gymnopus androsaceus JB14]|uniref:Uncharacterized protein n=1 Tax=Gymnopus androsaceus JB14 TaxID=1447944 RepID=A0A6A4HL86_9AGAR|nr:hypothetical protein BT96DRAFT_994174 [Gymnopus androsaceus JB14]